MEHIQYLVFYGVLVIATTFLFHSHCCRLLRFLTYASSPNNCQTHRLGEV